MHPEISVIMPSYNAAATIENSVLSVVKQNYSNWELLIIDDASSDSSVSKIESLRSQDTRIKLFKHGEHTSSPAAARNYGISLANGRYISFLDADDIWSPDKLSTQITFMKHNDIAISCTAYEVINEFSVKVGSFIPPESIDYQQLLKHNSIGCLTVMYDTKKIGKRYFPLCGHEDYALWLEIVKDGLIVYSIPEFLAQYRLSHGSITHNKLRLFRYFWSIYRKREKFPPLISAYYCLRYAWCHRGKYKPTNKKQALK
jgi:teichuronic acid biosynthesis glycosyltransferase TuaG